ALLLVLLVLLTRLVGAQDKGQRHQGDHPCEHPLHRRSTSKKCPAHGGGKTASLPPRGGAPLALPGEGFRPCVKARGPLCPVAGRHPVRLYSTRQPGSGARLRQPIITG